MLEIIASRGRRGASAKEQMSKLSKLREIADAHSLGLGVNLKLLLNIISTMFDMATSVTGYMDTENWHECHDLIMELIVRLMNNSDKVKLALGEGLENIEDSSKPYVVIGNAVTFVERLDDEYIKSLQNIDPHTPEYVTRLRDEAIIYNLIVCTEKYCTLSGAPTEDLSRAQVRRVEHLYYKRQAEKSIHVMSKPLESKEFYKFMIVEEEESDADALMDTLCKLLYKQDSSDRIRTRGMLCHIYHHALHDRWYEARDLMLMSHLQETISHSDIPTQVNIHPPPLCVCTRALVWPKMTV
jgi:translation initiation factor 3 subunit C